MKQRLTILSLLTLISGSVPAQLVQPQRPANFKPYRYTRTVEELKANVSPGQQERAKTALTELQQGVRKGPFRPEKTLDRHRTPEWFKDAKFGLFYDWGLWSVPGYDEQGFNRAAYPDTYLGFMYDKLKNYHETTWGRDFHRDDFIPLFTARQFDADALARQAKGWGFRYVVPFLKHMDGYCLWNNSFTQRDAVDMPPHRDLTKEMFAAFRKQGLKTGLYYCLEEFEYPMLSGDSLILRTSGASNVPELANPQEFQKLKPFQSSLHNRLLSGKVPVRHYVDEYVVPSVKEFIDQYDPDMLWFDAEWFAKADAFRTPELAAYFYNKNEGRKEVAVNDRFGIDSRGKQGDYYTSEFLEITQNLDHAWEECIPIGFSYGYNWTDTNAMVRSSGDLIKLLVRIVARGGNLLLLVAPDGEGKLPAYQTKRLDDIGTWLKQNGEAIYGTRSYPVITDDGNAGQNVWYTQSKDGKYGYGIFFEWPPTGYLILRKAKPKWNTKAYLLGHPEPLLWYDTGEKLWGMQLKLPPEMNRNVGADANKRPGQHAWVIKFENW